MILPLISSLILLSAAAAAPAHETTDIRFLYQCVDQHNIIRRNDGLNIMLDFDQEMEALSRQRAEQMATSSKLLLPVKDLPENSAFVPVANETISCRDVVSHWFHKHLHSKASQKFAHAAFRKDWDQFSRIGCARFMTQKPVVGSYVVCNYGLPLR